MARKSKRKVSAPAQPPSALKGATRSGLFAVFFAFPLIMGLFGLGLAYLEKTRNEERPISFDRDFGLPFGMAVVLSLIVALRTSRFQKPMQPLISLPSIRKRNAPDMASESKKND
jgi:hypothetical protein